VRVIECEHRGGPRREAPNRSASPRVPWSMLRALLVPVGVPIAAVVAAAVAGACATDPGAALPRRAAPAPAPPRAPTPAGTPTPARRSARVLLVNARAPGGAPRALALDGLYIRTTSATLTPAPDERVIDLGGRFVVPAFIDAHVHLAYFPEAAAMARGGVAGVLDLAAPLSYAPSRARPLALAWSGPMITAVGGYPTRDWGSDGYGLECATATEAADAVDLLAERGARVIKVPITGQPTLDDRALAAVTARAHARGLRVVAHALRQEGRAPSHPRRRGHPRPHAAGATLRRGHRAVRRADRHQHPVCLRGQRPHRGQPPPPPPRRRTGLVRHGLRQHTNARYPGRRAAPAGGGRAGRPRDRGGRHPRARGGRAGVHGAGAARARPPARASSWWTRTHTCAPRPSPSPTPCGSTAPPSEPRRVARLVDVATARFEQPSRPG
jgi:hypothetical protein